MMKEPKTIPFEKGYAQLVDEGLRPNPQPRPNPTMLPLAAICFATSVFQPRTKSAVMLPIAEAIPLCWQWPFAPHRTTCLTLC